MKNKKVWIKNILIPVLLGGVVGLIISRFMDYNTLEKPPLSPPGFIFGIVWTVLYVLMGISYGILDKKDLVDSKVKWAYYLQLVVNLIWPILFFVFKARLISSIWIVLLLILVINMIIMLYKKINFLHTYKYHT